MSLISIQNAYLSFNDVQILKNSTLHINPRERICLIGKNGTGKSTILKVINKTQDLDNGRIFYKKNIKISYLKQTNPNNLDISIYDFIVSGLYKKSIINNDSIIPNKKTIKIEDNIKIIKIIENIKLEKNTLLSELSGGLLRKVTLSRVLVGQSDLLLLDEPTNHLDIKTVRWLEKFLDKFTGSILFVSHDRNFIKNISTRIIDLDGGKLISWPGNYDNFIKLKNESNRIEQIKKKIFDKKLKKEELWIRKCVKARSIRNEGRVKNLKTLRKENDDYQKIEKLGKIKANQSRHHLGKILFELENIDFSINDQYIIKNFSSIIQNGDKLGLIGDNGCGKSTMIKILIGEKQPKRGKIYRNTGLKISYFDQNRSFLDSNKSILENMNYGNIELIVKYLNAFLFKPNELQSLVKTLSGGQRNRLLLAKLFLKPSNVLILDEPTNDLDLDSLQLLEKIIINYKGTVLLVSHDETFINNTINKYWYFEKNGIISTHVGKFNSIKRKEKSSKKRKIKINHHLKKITQNKIKKNLNDIFLKIEKTELQIKKLQNKINKIDFFKKDLENKLSTLKILSEKEKELEELLIYWEHLEKSTAIKKHNN